MSTARPVTPLVTPLLRLLPLLALAGLAPAALAAAPEYGTPVSVGAVAGSNLYSVANAANAAGAVVGVSDYRAFRWSAGGGIQNLGLLPGDDYSVAYAVNGSGVAAGSSTASDPTDPANGPNFYNHAAYWDAGGLHPLGVFSGDNQSEAYGINDAGQMVGFSGTDDTTTDGHTLTSHAFLWDSTRGLQHLSPLPGDNAANAQAINSSGQIVGGSASLDANGRGLPTAVLWDSGGVHSLGTLPGDDFSYAHAINDSGQVTGTSEKFANGAAQAPTQVRVFLWDSVHGMQNLGALPGAIDLSGPQINADVLAISNAGQIVGTFSVSGGSVAFVWDRAHGMRNLQSLVPANSGWTVAAASGINAHGQITGYGTYNNGSAALGFLLTPAAPPPSHTHLLWTNPDGKAAFWDVDSAGSVTAATAFGPYTDDGGGLWSATALATGPDGVSHLVWNNPDGKVALWTVHDDGSVSGVTPFGPYADGSSLWHTSGVSVGPDGAIHLLWANPDGKAAFWSVTPGGSVTGVSGYGPYFDGSSPWGAAGISTGPDGVSHLLWSNPDGKAAFWTLGGDGSIAGVTGYGPYSDGGSLWGAAGISTGPDGVSHLLWSNPDGKAAFWSLSGSGGIGGVTGYGPYLDGSSLWAAQALATSPDGVSHLLWDNPDGKAALWSLDGAGGIAGVAGFGPYTDGPSSTLWSAVGLSAGP